MEIDSALSKTAQNVPKFLLRGIGFRGVKDNAEFNSALSKTARNAGKKNTKNSTLSWTARNSIPRCLGQRGIRFRAVQTTWNELRQRGMNFLFFNHSNIRKIDRTLKNKIDAANITMEP
jgi:hypothetical protein